MSAKVKFMWSLPVVFVQKEKWVLASCPALDVHSQGKDENEARENIIEALKLFTESCFERGTLDEVLKECGFRVQRSKSIRLTKREKNFQYVEVPIPLLANCYAR